jgi:chromate transporter
MGMTFLALFWSFLKIGFTSFGGMSMIPLINSEMLRHDWMTITEVADIVAIAEMTPGPIGLNCATFAGLRVGGIGGALAANLGILSPTFTVGIVAALFFEKFQRSRILQHMMMGVRPACVGIIWSVIFSLCQTNYWATKDGIIWSSVGIGVLACYLILNRKWSIPAVLGIGAALGILTGFINML